MGRQTRTLFLPCKDKKHIFLTYEIVSFASREIKMDEAVKRSATAPVTSRNGCMSVSCLSCSFCLYFSTSSPGNTGFWAMWITGNPKEGRLPGEREAPRLLCSRLGQPGTSALPVKGLTLFAGSCTAAPTPVSNHFPCIPASVGICLPTRVRVSTTYFPSAFQALSSGCSLLSHSINCISHLGLRLNITLVSCPNLVSSLMLLSGNRSLALNCLRLGFSIRNSQCRVNCG